MNHYLSVPETVFLVCQKNKTWNTVYTQSVPIRLEIQKKNLVVTSSFTTIPLPYHCTEIHSNEFEFQFLLKTNFVFFLLLALLLDLPLFAIWFCCCCCCCCCFAFAFVQKYVIQQHLTLVFLYTQNIDVNKKKRYSNLFEIKIITQMIPRNKHCPMWYNNFNDFRNRKNKFFDQR